MNVLAIGSHPDDIEFGCGGTLLKYAHGGHDVHLLILSDGGKGGDPAVRRAEQLAAARLLPAREVHWGGYRDAEVPILPEAIQRIERIVEVLRPTLIFVHHQDDTHQDHRHASLCTVTATRYVRNVLFYEGPTTQNFTPTVFVDIEKQQEGKARLLEAHASQVMKTNIEGTSIAEIAAALARFRGIQGRIRHAEGFMPLRLFINI